MIRETRHSKQLREELDHIRSKGHHPARVFEDWVALMFWALQHNDDRYLEIMGRYDNTGAMGQRPADHFQRSFAELVLHMDKTGEEILGSLFMEYASDKYKGQFFTPPEVCELMAMLVVPEEGDRILDPACGAGLQLIWAAKAMRYDCKTTRGALFAGVDISFPCVCMTAINLLLFNLSGIVAHANSLSLESWGAWRIRDYPLPAIEPMTREEERAFLEGPFKEAMVRKEEEDARAEADRLANMPPPPPQQISMFEF